MMGDSIQATIGGVFRGLGLQNYVLVLNVLGFWVLAVPIGSLLTFVADLGVDGLWWGFTIGIYSSAAIGNERLERQRRGYPRRSLQRDQQLSDKVLVILQGLRMRG